MLVMKQSKIIIFFLLYIQICTHILIGQSISNVQNVFLIHSYHQGFFWTDEQNRGILSALDEKSGNKIIEKYTVYLDNRRFPDNGEYILDSYIKLLHKKRIDLIIVTDNYAYDLMKNNSWRISRKIPLLFSGVNNFNHEQISGLPGITGVAENFLTGRKETINAAIRIHKNLKEIIFILDRSTTSDAIRVELEEIRGYFQDLKFTYIVEEDFSGQIEICRSIHSGDRIIIPIGIHRERSGLLIPYEVAMSRIFSVSKVPCYGFIENRIGHGIVGGKILTSYDHGYECGMIGTQILNGKKPEHIKIVTDNPGRFIFDYFVMKKFNINLRDLPSGSTIINLPENIFEKYRNYIIVYMIILVMLVIIILVLFSNRKIIKSSIETISRSEKLLRTYFDNSPEGIFIANEYGRYLRVNKSGADLLGYSVDELIGMQIEDVVSEASLDLAAEHFRSLKENKISCSEISLTRKDGSEIIVRVHGVKLTEYEYLAIHTDVTERIRVEREAMEAREIAEKALKIKTQFLSNMSHEIRTPLNGLLGMVSLMSKTSLDRTQAEYLDMMKVSGRILLSIINDILDISRIEAGLKRANPRFYRLKEECSAIYQLFKHELNNKNIKYQFNFDHDIPEYLFCDMQIISQILINLINNAVKFTTTGVIDFSVNIQLKSVDKLFLTFTVLDTGIGIANDKLEKIFERFEQLDSSYTKSYAGTGLGLYIVKQLSEIIESEITVTSNSGAGSKFSITIPFDLTKEFNPEIDGQASLVVNTLNESREGNETEINIGHTGTIADRDLHQYDTDADKIEVHVKKNILVAEDNAINLLYLESVLKNAGYNVVPVRNGLEALNEYIKKKFDCVLMDIQMPVMDGISSTMKIRSIANIGRDTVKIVALTGYCSEEDKHKIQQASFDDYLFKPVDEKSLLRKLNEILRN